jgi:hypothetical protein
MSFFREKRPSAAQPADAERTMKTPERERAEHGEPRCARPDLARLLPDWPDLAAAERHALEKHTLECAPCAAGLALMREVDGWLAEPTPAGACPSADELYDYGRGPGARPMGAVERTALRAHLAACPDCARWVDTLADRPPAPLLDLPAPAAAAPHHSAPARTRAAELPQKAQSPSAAPTPPFQTGASPARRPTPTTLRLVAPLAAAAAALLILFALRGEFAGRPANSTLRFPAADLLRGEGPSPLLYPRDAVLLGSEGPWTDLRFECEPVERAELYRVVLRLTDGGAFDAGREVARAEGSAPLLAPTAKFDLAPGHYTWEAWARVDGLDVALGQRDFEARRETGLVAELELRSRAEEPARSESILHLLHEKGFLGDARAYARTLPASPERDAYLARHPGR